MSKNRTESDATTIKEQAGYPLTPQQLALWLLYQREPENTAYNTGFAAELVSKIDVIALRTAFELILDRHPALRTIFLSQHGEPRQQVLMPPELFFMQIDASTWSREELNDQVVAALKRPFNLEKGPLLRVFVFTQRPDAHVLLISMHHIVSDGHSFGILLNELRTLYPALCVGDTLNLAELKVTNADYEVWLSKMLQSAQGQRMADFWHQHLAGELPLLDLPMRHKRPADSERAPPVASTAVQRYHGASCGFTLSKQQTEELKTFAQAHRFNLHTICMTAYQILLHRYSGQSDFLVGTTVSNRLMPQSDKLFGYLTNILVWRSQLTSNDKVLDTMQTVQRFTRQALFSQAYPFPILDLKLRQAKQVHSAELIQAGFNFWRPPTELSLFWTPLTPEVHNTVQVDWGGLVMKPLALPQNDTIYDLYLELIDGGDRLSGALKYRTERFDADTIERMTSHFQILLAALVANPSQSIAKLPLLTEQERHQLLVKWNDTKTDYPLDKCIHQLFEEQAKRTPQAIAVVFGDQQLTYHELNTRANQLAHYLIAQGVGPDVLVGICVKRSLEMVISLLAVLKAGGVYVPIDPTYPEERIRYILTDSAAPILLTQSQLLQRAPWVLQHPVEHVISVDELVYSQPMHNPSRPTSPEAVAYVIYTSGSTGQPKGVEGLHRGAVNRLQWMWETFPFEPNEVGCAKTSLSFVDAVAEIFGPLLQGIPVIIADDHAAKDPHQLVHLLASFNVTRLVLVPSLLHSLLNSFPDLHRRLPKLKFWVSSGEALSSQLCQRFHDMMPERILLNLYGSSEVSADVTFYNTSDRALDHSKAIETSQVGVPIGRPIANTQVYILDANLQPVPLGVVGELYIGGAGVARGYLNRAQLTAQKFVPNPFASGRLYRTGDLCRYLPSLTGAGANIEFVGRFDAQVKIRGFRIELGEIESALLAAEGVREAVVLARAVQGDTRLVGYLVGDADTDTLRLKLSQRLPDYMVPSAFVTMNAMPLTPNGKLDRRALPAPDYADTQTAYVPPRNALEQQVADIWASVLDLEQIGIYDNFFRLGGHSLLATQVISRIRAQLDFEVPLKSLFSSSQLGAFARQISQAQESQGTELTAKEEATSAVIRKVARDGQLPLSFAQQRLWFLDQLEPDSALYNIPFLIRLEGALDVLALEQSFAYLMARHESLRTTFGAIECAASRGTVRGGEPIQIIHEPQAFRLSVTTLSGEQEAQKRAQGMAITPFDLSEGRLLRVELLKLADQRHWLVLTMHHIISDGWSIGVLVKELTHAYAAYAQAKRPTLAPLPIQYADFAVWQRDYLSGDTVDAQLSFWREHLAGAPAQLSLPTDRPRPSVQTHRGANYRFNLSRELTEQLNQLAQTHDATLFMVLLSGFNVLLSRYSRQTDIVLGTPIANRNRAEIEGLIGFFVNTLVLRTQLDDNPTFSSLLQRVRENTLAAYEHQDLPFEQLVDELQPERSLSYTPLFQVMLVLQNAELGSFVLPDSVSGETSLSGTIHFPDFPFAKFDLTLFLIEGDEGLMGLLEYNTDLFSEVTMARMVSHFEVLLNSIVKHPLEPVLQLPMLTDAEYHQIVHQFNDTQVDFGEPQTIHALFEQQVERTPDTVALIFSDQAPRLRSSRSSVRRELTYAEVNARANQLAHHLIELGVQADTLVAVAMERSLEMVISLLAVLKAGGAYVPIDPTYPAERIRYMLTDSAAPILLTQSHLSFDIDNEYVIAVDRVGAIDARTIHNPSLRTSPEQLAYVIYTSGSTGQPKGVEGLHRGAVNRLQWMWETFPFEPDGVGCAKTSLSFVDAVAEIFGPLLQGIPVIIADDHAAKDPHQLVHLLASFNVTRLVLVPSLLHSLLNSFPDLHRRLPKLKFWVSSGEALSSQLCQRFHDMMPERILLNLYGSSEVSADVTFYNTSDWALDHSKAIETSQVGVPIGRPIANTQVYILDANLQPVPLGVVGELYIGGAGVARGYLNRAQLTAQKFVPNPFASGTLYRMGDLCRYLPSLTGAGANIEFVGRTDHQVNIRGLRIELGEIESALLAAEGVREAVVLARAVQGDTRLVGYLVGDADTDTLRLKLSQRLPDYMVPSAFVTMNAMPLTPNGKLDRRALPAPDYADTQTAYVPPRNALEQQVADIWASVLDVEQIGIHDNFFRLGGHSLLATQVISRVRAQLDFEVPLKTLFSSSQLGAFARQISQAQESRGTELTAKEEATSAVIRKVARDGQLPLSFAQQRLWFLDQLEPDSALYNIPFFIRLEGALDVLALEQSLAYLMARHESLRTTFGAIECAASAARKRAGGTVRGGEPIQIIHEPQAFRLSVTTLSGEQEARQRAQGMAITPFDLSEGPLLRVQLLKLADQRHWLVLTMHHIISDGWSTGVLIKELTHAYAAYAQGNVPTLAPLPIQYADFAVWQRDYLSGDTVDAQLSFWREHLAGAPAQLSLPTDRPRPSVQSSRGARYIFNLDRELTDQLNQLAQSHDASLFMVLLSGFNVLLSRYSRQTDIVLGTPIANRNRAEIEGLIGFFVNTLVLRTQLDDNPTFSSLLYRVRNNTLAAYEHQDLPFEQLVDELQPERSLSYTPLFQVMLVLQNLEMGLFVLPDSVSGETSLSGTIDFPDFPFAKFDLTLFLMEDNEGLGAAPSFSGEQALRGMLQYNTALFDEATIARMASHFEVLLNSMVSQPDQPVLQLPMLADAEYHQLVHQFNQTNVDFGEPQTIHAMFEAQVSRTPDAVAVVFAPDGHDKHEQLTYHDLNIRANQLAHHLISLGVQPDTLVAIAMERSLEMVVSLLAVLKAGGAYVPIDPTYPEERINAILADTQASILLKIRTRSNDFSRSGPGTTEVVTTGQEIISRQSTENPQSAATSRHLAYVLYTSGSTGRPKGVMIEHGNMLNYVNGIVLRFDLKPQARFALAQSLQFDLGLTMLYPALMTGGTLHILNQYEATDPIEFARTLRKYTIDYLKITPTHLSALIDDRLDIQIALILGGEAADTQWVARLQAANPHLQLFNHFGPTETTVGVVAHKVQSGSYVSTIPIGHPLPNNRAFIFDSQQQPVPIGVPGELYIGGPQVARGYLNRPELTAERFIEHAQFGRLYRTGDLCRWLPILTRSGTTKACPDEGRIVTTSHYSNIEFIGRIDFQVKIRGFRVELGEIESALLAQDGVREAVVLARENDLGDKRLVAYFVPIGDADSAYSDTLRQQLAQRLPDYMIPSAFVSLESMPLTPNGKLDRRALPAPNYADAQTAFVPPRNALEQQVADIWASVLGIEQACPEGGGIGIYDNFFALGGHSLLATQVISRMRAQLNLEIPLKTLFKAPQLAAFAEHVSQTQQSLVGTELTLSEERTTATIRPVPRSGQLPLSFAQQRLWFLNQLEPDSPLYNIPTMIRLEGQLHVVALEQTFTYLIARHESFRTTFETVHGEPPIQVIHAPSPFRLPILVVSDEQQAQTVGLAEATTPFDLSEGPLLRVQLLKLTDEMHWLLLNMHHIISDGWSRGVLVKELTHAYTAYAEGNVPTLPTLPIQYADFAVWQRDILKGQILDDHLSFWREALTGAPARLELPTDRPRPPVQSHRGAHYAFKLNYDLIKQLNQLAQTHDATLFMVLLSAFKVLLSRYSRQTDMVVGTPIANRNRAEIEGLIGFFVNTLALRTELDDKPSFTALLHRVRESTLAAYEHQDLPFEQLVDELQPERTLSYSPLFQVMLVLQNAERRTEPVLRQAEEPRGSFALPGLTATREFSNSLLAKFDLTLFLMEGQQGLEGMPPHTSAWIEYSTDLFDESTIARMASHFTVLLNSIVADPDQAIFQLPLLTESEYHQIVHQWNDRAVDFGEPQTIHALFEAQVERTPNAVALVFPPIPIQRSRAEHDKGKQLTYHDLNVRANQLAHHLISLGVQPDTLVAVAMERSIEMVVSLLAVLKAGGAYVPIDPTYPSERIRYMLTDSVAPILLTQSHLLPDYDTKYDTKHIIAVDTAGAIDVQPTQNPQTRTSPEHLAYVIYTSGSTGQPKGVANEHHGVFNRLRWTQQEFQLTRNDRVLQKTPFSFDVSVWEFFWTLMSGACLVVAQPEGHKDPAYLCDLIQRKRITVMHFVPSMLRQFISSPTIKNCTSLRIIITSGEALPLDLAQETSQALPATGLHNLYGPTEAAIDVSHWAYVDTSQIIPIGKPIANTTLYILDNENNVLPIGVSGELHIGGIQVAREYLNRAELTAERFIEHPQFGRLYKTGDLCRWLLDGNIEYMGRTDFQVKIRGFRIELGEIENALLSQDGVREAVVLAREDNAVRGDKRLVAYVVGASNTNIDSETFRQRLSQRLPDYMVPSAFVQLSAMPLSPNGKLDRRALPAPNYMDVQSAFVAPRNEVETSLAHIFAEVLRVPQVGIHDNFFRMGGDSILSIQLVSQAAQQGYTLSVKDVFQHPTIAELATVLATERAPEVHASQDMQIGDALLLPIQRWFLGLKQAQMHHFNQSVLLMLKQPIDPVQLEAAIGTLLRHHDALRFQYEHHQGWQQQYIAPSAHVPLEIVELQAIPPEYRPAKACADAGSIEAVGAQTQASLNPLSGDLMRWVYFRSGDSGYDDRLLIVIHHLAVDGVSWRILLEDLATLLDGRQLPPKTSSYRDWVKVLQSATQNGYFDADISQWLDNGSSKDTPLPLDEPDALNTMGNSHRLSLTLSRTQTEQLLRTLPDLHDMTLDGVLLTVLTETLTDWSGLAALRVKFESHGRQELFDRTINLNRTVGWFTSVYPLTIPRFDGSAVKRIRYTLDQLRRVTDGGISFGALRYFHPDDTIREQFEALPTAPVVYNYLGQLDNLHNQRFEMAQEFTGSPISPHFQRETLIDSNAFVANGQLHIKWTVSPQLYHETAQSLLNSFKQHLDLLMAEALDNRTRVAIPSDFVDANLSREQLESLLNDSTPTQTELFIPSEDDEEF